jgi:hypothetical protein
MREKRSVLGQSSQLSLDLDGQSCGQSVLASLKNLFLGAVSVDDDGPLGEWSRGEPLLVQITQKSEILECDGGFLGPSTRADAFKIHRRIRLDPQEEVGHDFFVHGSEMVVPLAMDSIVHSPKVAISPQGFGKNEENGMKSALKKLHRAGTSREMLSNLRQHDIRLKRERVTVRVLIEGLKQVVRGGSSRDGQSAPELKRFGKNVDTLHLVVVREDGRLPRTNVALEADLVSTLRNGTHGPRPENSQYAVHNYSAPGNGKHDQEK